MSTTVKLASPTPLVPLASLLLLVPPASLTRQGLHVRLLRVRERERRRVVWHQLMRVAQEPLYAHMCVQPDRSASCPLLIGDAGRFY